MTAFPANPYFCLKPGKHDVTLTLFVVGVSKVPSFPFVRMCQIDSLESIENFGDDPFVTLGDIAKKTRAWGGAKK